MPQSKYRVTGTQEVLGHQPGDTFDADLDPDQESTLIESGALEQVRSSDGQPKSAEGSSAGSDTPKREE